MNRKDMPSGNTLKPMGSDSESLKKLQKSIKQVPTLGLSVNQGPDLSKPPMPVGFLSSMRAPSLRMVTNPKNRFKIRQGSSFS
jgi:hypothetical protein